MIIWPPGQSIPRLFYYNIVLVYDESDIDHSGRSELAVLPKRHQTNLGGLQLQVLFRATRNVLPQ